MLAYEENEFLREFVTIFKVFEEITIVTVSQIIPFSQYIMSYIENQQVNTLPTKFVLTKFEEVASRKLKGLKPTTLQVVQQF